MGLSGENHEVTDAGTGMIEGGGLKERLELEGKGGCVSQRT